MDLAISNQSCSSKCKRLRWKALLTFLKCSGGKLCGLGIKSNLQESFALQINRNSTLFRCRRLQGISKMSWSLIICKTWQFVLNPRLSGKFQGRFVSLELRWLLKVILSLIFLKGMVLKQDCKNLISLQFRWLWNLTRKCHHTCR